MILTNVMSKVQNDILTQKIRQKFENKLKNLKQDILKDLLKENPKDLFNKFDKLLNKIPICYENKKNKFKESILNKNKQIGIWSCLTNNTIAEIIAVTGFDWSVMIWSIHLMIFKRF